MLFRSFEITTLLIPDENDSDAEVHAECAWLAEHLGPDVPLHFSAFHPDYKMLDKPHTPPATLTRARTIALEHGLHYVYTGNVHDTKGGSSYCPACGACLIERDWYELLAYQLDVDASGQGRCRQCAHPIPGLFAPQSGHFGRHRIPVRIALSAD